MPCAGEVSPSPTLIGLWYNLQRTRTHVMAADADRVHACYDGAAAWSRNPNRGIDMFVHDPFGGKPVDVGSMDPGGTVAAQIGTDILDARENYPGPGIISKVMIILKRCLKKGKSAIIIQPSHKNLSYEIDIFPRILFKPARTTHGFYYEPFIITYII